MGWAFWQEGRWVTVLQESTQGSVPALVRLTVVSWVFSHDPSLPFSPGFNEHDLLGRCFETM